MHWTVGHLYSFQLKCHNQCEQKLEAGSVEGESPLTVKRTWVWNPASAIVNHAILDK